MELQKTFKDLIKYGSQNAKHRKEVIENSAWLIAVLTENFGKKLSDKDLDKISAGLGAWLLQPK